MAEFPPLREYAWRDPLIGQWRLFGGENGAGKNWLQTTE